VKRHAWSIAAFAWGVAEGTLFFIVPDVILSLIGLKRGARDAAFASLIAAIGAACGGIVMCLWSAHDPAAAHAAVNAVPAVSDAMMARAQYDMGEHWFYATALGPLTSTPYKVFAVLAPQAGVPLVLFAIGSVFARLPRFLLASVAAALARRWLGRWFSERALTYALAVFWIGFYAIFFSVMTAEPQVSA
jgi:membrane protein YqaA with SNARE-associated domain